MYHSKNEIQGNKNTLHLKLLTFHRYLHNHNIQIRNILYYT